MAPERIRSVISRIDNLCCNAILIVALQYFSRFWLCHRPRAADAQPFTHVMET